MDNNNSGENVVGEKTTVAITEKGRRVVDTNIKGFGVIDQLFKATVCFAFTIVLIVMGNSVLVEMGADGYGPVVFTVFTNLSMLFYVGLLLAYASSLFVVMLPVKKIVFPTPPVEDLCVDFLLVTVAGICLSVLASSEGVPVWLVLIAALIFLYPAATRLYKHLNWWLVEVPATLKRESKGKVQA